MKTVTVDAALKRKSDQRNGKCVEQNRRCFESCLAPAFAVAGVVRLRYDPRRKLFGEVWD